MKQVYPPEGEEIKTCKECKYYTLKWRFYPTGGRPPGPPGVKYLEPYCEEKGKWIGWTRIGKPWWCPLPILAPTTLKEKAIEYSTLAILISFILLYAAWLLWNIFSGIFK